MDKIHFSILACKLAYISLCVKSYLNIGLYLIMF